MRRVVGFGAATRQGDWPVQEDAYWIDPVQGIFVLADGFGGCEAGDKAAAAAVNAAGSFLVSDARAAVRVSEAHPFYSLEEAQVAEAMNRAGAAVEAVNAGRDFSGRGGASLIVCHCLPSGRVVIGNLGNTGAVVLRSGKSVTILQPQSFVASQGGTVGEYPGRFGRDFPLQFLGLFPRTEPDIRTYHFQGGDQLFLFTEGLVAGRLPIFSEAAVLLEADRESRHAGQVSERLEDLAKEILELARPAHGLTRNQSLVLIEL